ncbi:unnamed protein product [Brassica oleracea var. botrytis]|uniref:(rape) hypothetical protein n=1 Tax=Brassica napus TaxID=3708 RepID=A0A816L3P5_BRANA|nr:unnamed protein product [Brassica napus]
MRICFQSFLITNQFETQLINSPPPPSWAYKNRYLLFLCRSESSKFSHSLKFIKTFLKFSMANRSPETTANGQSSETTFVRNEEEQAVERIEGNGGVRAPSLVVGGLKDGDEASLERIHHLLTPTFHRRVTRAAEFLEAATTESPPELPQREEHLLVYQILLDPSRRADSGEERSHRAPTETPENRVSLSPLETRFEIREKTKWAREAQLLLRGRKNYNYNCAYSTMVFS